jgi:hypothetical protein
MGRTAGFVRRKAAEHVKNDDGKIKFTLVPPRALRAVAEAMTYGREKYPTNDFRKVEDGYERYDDAARRHMNAADCGELVDPESELLHLAHAASNLLMQLEILLIKLEQHAENTYE